MKISVLKEFSHHHFSFIIHLFTYLDTDMQRHTVCFQNYVHHLYCYNKILLTHNNCKMVIQLWMFIKSILGWNRQLFCWLCFWLHEEAELETLGITTSRILWLYFCQQSSWTLLESILSILIDLKTIFNFRGCMSHREIY